MKNGLTQPLTTLASRSQSAFSSFSPRPQHDLHPPLHYPSVNQLDYRLGLLHSSSSHPFHSVLVSSLSSFLSTSSYSFSVSQCFLIISSSCGFFLHLEHLFFNRLECLFYISRLSPSILRSHLLPASRSPHYFSSRHRHVLDKPQRHCPYCCHSHHWCQDHLEEVEGVVVLSWCPRDICSASLPP